jgi:hypothetical protein
MTQPTNLPPGAETVQVPVDFPTYQAQLRRLLGDQLADGVMDRAMLSAQVEVLHRQNASGEHERAELAGQVGVLTQQLRAAQAPDAATDGDGEVSEGDTR